MARQRRNRGSSDDGGADRWLGTYGDMITLLMAFFVMLYAISQVDQEKFAELIRGLGVFGNTSTVEGLIESGPELLNEGAAVESLDVTSDDQPAAGERGGEPERSEKQATDEQVAEIRRRLDKALERAGLPGNVTEVRRDPRGVVISVSTDDVLFALGSTELSRKGKRIVGAIAEVLAAYDEEVVVEGHTDNLPLRRRGYSNWNLSTDRAVVVVNRLHDTHGIDQRRLSATGYSEFRPLRPNTTAANRARNRRVDVLLRINGE